MLNPGPNKKKKLLWIAIIAFLLVLFMYNEWIKQRMGAGTHQNSGVVPPSSLTETKPNPLTHDVPASVSNAPQPRTDVESSSGSDPAERSPKEIIYEIPSNEKILIQ